MNAPHNNQYQYLSLCQDAKNTAVSSYFSNSVSNRPTIFCHLHSFLKIVLKLREMLLSS